MLVIDLVTFELLWKATKKCDVGQLRRFSQLHAERIPQFVNQFHPRKGMTLLMLACKSRDRPSRWRSGSAADVVQFLLEAGADANLQDRSKQGYTAMHFAAASNQAQSIKCLLQAGGSPFVLSRRGHAPIDIARWKCSVDAIAVLTACTLVKSGWLHVTKRGAHGLHPWRSRFCVMLACDPTGSTLELAIHKNETHTARPYGVVFLRVGENVLSQPRESSWIDRPNMFCFDRPMAVHRPTNPRRFSRHPSDLLQVVKKAADVEQLQFAAASVQERCEWMNILQSAQPMGASNYQAAMAVEVVPVPVNASDTTANTPMPDAPSIRMSSLSTVSSQSTTSQRSPCCFCMEAPRDAVCVPCGHVPGCLTCVTQAVSHDSVCPICAAPVERVIRILD